MKTPDRTVEYLPLRDLVDDPRNPKDHDINTIDASLNRFGVLDLIVRDERTGRIVSGHGRKHTLEGMEARGEEPPQGVTVDDEGRWLVPVVTGWASDDDLEAAAALIALNRTTELGGWNDDALLDLLDELAAADDIAGIGFDTADLDALRDDLDDLDDVDLTDLDRHDPALDDDETVDPAAAQEAARTLADRFGVPPVTVLDTISGHWINRRRAWTTLGIASYEGRDESLLYESGSQLYNNWYEVKNRADKAAGRSLSEEEILAEYQGELVRYNQGKGTSTFDPVLAEIIYEWFSAPGDRVIDPWAGGSVRGIVAAMTGREYHGVELRQEQVDRNEAQWNEKLQSKHVIIGETRTAPDFTPALTPVEKHGDIWIKREDLWTRGGASGAKSRAMFTVAENAEGLVTAGARNSAQIERGALVAKALNIACRVHVGAGKETPEMKTAADAGAEVVQADAGYLNVIKKRFRDDAAKLSKEGWAVFPFGMEHPTYLEQVAEQVANLPDEATRIVVPYGSGMTLAGVLRGLDANGDDRPVLAVSVGTADETQLDTYAPGWKDRVTVVKHPSEYSTPAKTLDYEGVRLDPLYEAKCIPYLEPGDVLWTVGIRNSALPAHTGREGTPPKWITGASPQKLYDLDRGAYQLAIGCPPYYDLEEYSDDERDLSNMTHDEFDDAMNETIRATADLLADDSFAVFVVANVRDKKGDLIDMRQTMNTAAAGAGLKLANSLILRNNIGTVAIRAARGFIGGRSIAPVHQEVIVYVKGDRKAAAKRLGEPSMMQVDAAPADD